MALTSQQLLQTESVRYLQELDGFTLQGRLWIKKYHAFFVDFQLMHKVGQLNARKLNEGIVLSFVKRVNQTEVNFPH